MAKQKPCLDISFVTKTSTLLPLLSNHFLNTQWVGPLSSLYLSTCSLPAKPISTPHSPSLSNPYVSSPYRSSCKSSLISLVRSRVQFKCILSTLLPPLLRTLWSHCSLVSLWIQHAGNHCIRSVWVLTKQPVNLSARPWLAFLFETSHLHASDRILEAIKCLPKLLLLFLPLSLPKPLHRNRKSNKTQGKKRVKSEWTLRSCEVLKASQNLIWVYTCKNHWDRHWEIPFFTESDGYLSMHKLMLWYPTWLIKFKAPCSGVESLSPVGVLVNLLDKLTFLKCVPCSSQTLLTFFHT